MLSSLGFEQVYQLKGGILKYLEEVPAESSLFEGECYVFDHRAAVKAGLEVGESTLCWGCRHPLKASDTKHSSYQEGIQCIYCADSLDEETKKAREERNRQMRLAEAAESKHLGFQKKGPFPLQSL